MKVGDRVVYADSMTTENKQRILNIGTITAIKTEEMVAVKWDIGGPLYVHVGELIKISDGR